MGDGTWPAGIRPRGRGIEIRIWQHGRLAHSETIPGDPYKKADLKAAVERRADLVARLRLGQPLYDRDPDSRIFDDLAQRYLDSLHMLEIDQQTIKEYANQLNRYWVPEFGGWPITDISNTHILDALSDLDVSQKTRKNALIPLSGVFAYSGVQPNPAAGIKFGKRQTAKPERYKPAERDRVLDKLEGQDKVYFALLFATGLRPGEACALEWSDWDGEQLYVGKQITKGKLKPRTKTHKARRVYVPKWVRPILLEHTTRFDGGYIFTNTQGNPYRQTRYLNRAWEKAHKRARVRLRSPYVCRHTRAAELLSMGIAPADAASQLGHSVTVFLTIYSEFIAEYSDKQDFSRFELNTEHPPHKKGHKNG